MREVVYVRPLPEWTVNGVTYQSKHAQEAHCHPALDNSITLVTGEWKALPDVGGRQLANSFLKQNKQTECPAMQRYELEIREEADDDDSLQSALPGVPVRKMAKRKDAAAPAPVVVDPPAHSPFGPSAS